MSTVHFRNRSTRRDQTRSGREYGHDPDVTGDYPKDQPPSHQAILVLIVGKMLNLVLARGQREEVYLAALATQRVYWIPVSRANGQGRNFLVLVAL